MVFLIIIINLTPLGPHVITPDIASRCRFHSHSVHRRVHMALRPCIVRPVSLNTDTHKLVLSFAISCLSSPDYFYFFKAQYLWTHSRIPCNLYFMSLFGLIFSVLCLGLDAHGCGNWLLSHCKCEMEQKLSVSNRASISTCFSSAPEGRLMSWLKEWFFFTLPYWGKSSATLGLHWHLYYDEEENQPLDEAAPGTSDEGNLGPFDMDERLVVWG